MKAEGIRNLNTKAAKEAKKQTPGNGLQSQVCALSPHANALHARLRNARGKMVQVAPGKYAPVNMPAPPELSLCAWIQNPDGTFTPKPYEESLVRVNKQLCSLLGFPGRWQTLYRLARMGCVEVIQAAPKFYLLNLHSWYNHLRRCSEDPEFWAEGKGYVEEYRKVEF